MHSKGKKSCPKDKGFPKVATAEVALRHTGMEFVHSLTGTRQRKFFKGLGSGFAAWLGVWTPAFANKAQKLEEQITLIVGAVSID